MAGHFVVETEAEKVEDLFEFLEAQSLFENERIERFGLFPTLFRQYPP